MCRLVSLSVAVVLVVSSLTCAEEHEQESGQAPNTVVASLLACGLERSDDCRKRLEEAESESGSPKVKKLASVMLAEWDLPWQHEVFSSPRLVWLPERTYPEEIGNLRWTMTVVVGQVGANGLVISARIQRSTGSGVIDDVCIASFRQALFRPPVRDGDYVPGEYVLSCEVYPRR